MNADTINVWRVDATFYVMLESRMIPLTMICAEAGLVFSILRAPPKQYHPFLTELFAQTTAREFGPFISVKFTARVLI